MKNVNIIYKGFFPSSQASRICSFQALQIYSLASKKTIVNFEVERIVQSGYEVKIRLVDDFGTVEVRELGNTLNEGLVVATRTLRQAIHKFREDLEIGRLQQGKSA